MRRVALILTVLGILGFAASQVQAHDFYHYGGYHHSGYYGSYYGPVVVRPPVYYAPRVVVSVPPPVVYRPAYCYPYCAPCGRYGLYYQSRGLSLGVGF